MYGLKTEDREKVLQALLSKEKVLQLLYKKTFPEPVASGDGQPSRPFSAAAAIASRPTMGGPKSKESNVVSSTILIGSVMFLFGGKA